MAFTGLLLLAMVLPGVVEPIQPVATDQATYSLSAGQSLTLTPDPASESTLSSSDHVCYKIRAYIFKRDDDHAPEYVGSTTCGTGKLRLKGTSSPKARVVPAH